MLGDLGILGKEIHKRPAGRDHFAADVIDEIVRVLAAELWPNSVTAVSAVPDPRKGERLIMVTDKHGATRADFMAYARSKHAAELMFPAEVVVLDKLPLLGSGKVDQLAIDKFVREQAAAKAAAAE